MICIFILYLFSIWVTIQQLMVRHLPARKSRTYLALSRHCLEEKNALRSSSSHNRIVGFSDMIQSFLPNPFICWEKLENYWKKMHLTFLSFITWQLLYFIIEFCCFQTFSSHDSLLLKDLPLQLCKERLLLEKVVFVQLNWWTSSTGKDKKVFFTIFSSLCTVYKTYIVWLKVE